MASEDRRQRIIASTNPCPDSLEPALTTTPQPPRMSRTARQGIHGVVIVKVGAERRQYLVHSVFLSHYSKALEILLLSRNPIDLQFVKPKVFDIFVDWMYTQKLPQLSQWDCLLIAQCYDFAHRHLAPSFVEATGNAFVDKVFTTGVTSYHLNIIFAYSKIHKHTGAHDRLLRLLVDYHCDKYRPEGIQGEEDMLLDEVTAKKIPRKFWMAVMDKYARISIGYASAEMGGIRDYHQHTRKEDQNRCEDCRETRRNI